jgi:hypothetical protein
MKRSEAPKPKIRFLINPTLDIYEKQYGDIEFNFFFELALEKL